MGMTYETGKNFEKVQALLEEHEQKINYLMIRLGEKAAAKKAAEKPAAKPAKEPEEETAVEEIVEQELNEQPVPKKKKIWQRNKEEGEEAEPARIL